MTFINHIPLFGRFPISINHIINYLYQNTYSEMLLQRIQKQGQTIHIEINNLTPTASWSWEHKLIILNPQLLTTSFANQIAFIIFELYNALSSKQFKLLVERHKADLYADDFVREFEKIEHQSTLQTKNLMKLLFGNEKPKYNLLDTFDDFESHYAVQQISGHSNWIAQTYFPNKKFIGSLLVPLNEIDSNIKKILQAIAYYLLTIEKTGCEESLHKFEKIILHIAQDNTYRKTLAIACDAFPQMNAYTKQ